MFPVNIPDSLKVFGVQNHGAQMPRWKKETSGVSERQLVHICSEASTTKIRWIDSRVSVDRIVFFVSVE